MDWISAVLGGAELLGGFMGANDARDEANRAHARDMAMMNAQIGEANQNRALQSYFMNRAYGDSQLGQTDAMGNRTYFEPGVGQVVKLSPMAQMLLDASNREQMQQLTVDAPAARTQQMKNYARQDEEGKSAETILQQLMQGPEYTRDQLEALFRDRMMRDSNEAFDNASSNINRTALRTGADVSGTMAKMIGKQAEARRNIGTDAKINAINAFDSSEGNRANRLGSMYGLLASRASGVPNVPFNPFNTNSIDAQAGANARSTAAMSGNFQPMNQMQGIKAPGPNYANALFTQGAGAMVGGLYNQFANRQKGNTSDRGTSYGSGWYSSPMPDDFWQ